MKRNGLNTSTNETKPLVSRRNFLRAALLSAGGTLLSGLGLYKYFRGKGNRKYPGRIVGSSSQVGHMIRDGQCPRPKETREIETVIVGGGISGLSAAWWFAKNQYDKFVLLELENQVGGNSQNGKNEVSAYPWGAHYLPLPGKEAVWVRELLQDLGVIRGYDSAGQPIYNEFYLCADPHERLFIQGRWQEGMIPQLGISEQDRHQYDEFFKLIEHYKLVKGHDGKRAFVIPVDLSSQDPEFLALDQITMAEFLKRKKWDSTYLHWYINYCCRDDYGMGYEYISAWAGIHYFASRIGTGANADSKTVLTWPEGNGWLVKQLHDRLSGHIKSNTAVFSIENEANDAWVDYFDTSLQQSFRIKAKKVIFAAPRFVSAGMISNFKESKPAYLKELHYAPWMVANLTLRTSPGGKGAPLSWDNVSFYSNSMGYVVATHQSIKRFQTKTVITYYLPLTKHDPSTARKEALQKTHAQWAKLIVEDLTHMHPGIEEEIENIDVWIWGHGMISPQAGYMWGPVRNDLLKPIGNVHFAHTDMSGISIFEEAQYRGMKAAQELLEQLYPFQARSL